MKSAIKTNKVVSKEIVSIFCHTAELNPNPSLIF